MNVYVTHLQADQIVGDEECQRRLEKHETIAILARDEGHAYSLLHRFVGVEVGFLHWRTHRRDKLEIYQTGSEDFRCLQVSCIMLDRFLGSIELLGVLAMRNDRDDPFRRFVIEAKEGAKSRIFVRDNLDEKAGDLANQIVQAF